MQLHFSRDELRPLIEAVAAELLHLFPISDAQRLAFSEAEAADLLGVSRTSLRDERLRGRVSASLVGRKIRYSRSDLIEYLASRRWAAHHHHS